MKLIAFESLCLCVLNTFQNCTSYITSLSESVLLVDDIEFVIMCHAVAEVKDQHATFNMTSFHGRPNILLYTGAHISSFSMAFGSSRMQLPLSRSIANRSNSSMQTSPLGGSL